MKKLDLIVLDQDGVLSDFYKSASKLFNIKYNKNDPKKWFWFKDYKISENDFWKKIDNTPNFWLNLEVFDYAKSLIKLIENYTNEIIICTHPSNASNGYSQKKQWLRNNGFGVYKVFIGNANKGLLASPNRLLIDDYVDNVEDFIEYGGKAILFPKPYNIEYIEDLYNVPYNKELLYYIEKQLNNIVGG